MPWLNIGQYHQFLVGSQLVGMQLSPFVSLIAGIALKGQESGGKLRKPVLRNYPHCGELGDEENKECLWDCDWQPIPDNIIANFGPLRNTEFVESAECLRDCKSIQTCLATAQPV